MYKYIIIFILFCSTAFILYAQQSPEIHTGDAADTLSFSDSDFIFTSPRPLLQDEFSPLIKRNAAAIDLMLSNSGFGFGIIYERIISQRYRITTEVFFSPVKNTDEIPSIWDWDRYEYLVSGKVNRLYAIPLAIGIQRYIDIGNLSKTLRPYINLCINPTLIWRMPYTSTWFDNVGASKAYYRMGGGIQMGFDIGAINTSYVNVKMRYMYTPFGGDGLESVAGSPIKNFGDFYLSLALGGFF